MSGDNLNAEAAIFDELWDLLSVKGKAPTAIGDDSALAKWVATRYSNHYEIASTLAWLLIESAVHAEPIFVDANDYRPLLAAKYLLGLGRFPEHDDEVVENTNHTLGELRSFSNLTKETDPYAAGIVFRRKVAVQAGGYGTEHTNLGRRKDKRLPEVTRYLLQEIKKLALDADRVNALAEVAWVRNRLSQDGDHSQMTLVAGLDQPVRNTRLVRRVSRKSGQMFLRVIRAMRRTVIGGWILRQTTSLLFWAAFGLVGLVMLSFLAPLMLPLLPQYDDRLNPVDPLTTLKQGTGWSGGWGPSTNVRAEQSTSSLEINPVDVMALPTIWPASLESGQFLKIAGVANPNSIFGPTSLQPGTYKMTVEARLAQNSDFVLTDKRATESTVQLGILPSTYDYGQQAVFARIKAKGIAAVWDGQELTVTCNCTVDIDPTSIRMSSDKNPHGTYLGAAALEDGALIGTARDDGILQSGISNEVTINANIVVKKRTFVPF